MSTHPEIPEDVAALISAHALGVLEPDQAELAERHIAASDACRRAYEDALETAAALALCRGRQRAARRPARPHRGRGRAGRARARRAARRRARRAAAAGCGSPAC